MAHHLPNQRTDKAIGAIFGPVLQGSKGVSFFSSCLRQRVEALPAWVKEDITALRLSACRLGGKAVHEKVEAARAACGDRGDRFYEEVAEAIGALLEGEMLIFAEYRAEVRALAGWSVGGMRGGTPAAY